MPVLANIPFALDIRAFVAACHRLAGYRLVSCSSGNLSWRIARDRMLVTGTRTWLGSITAQQVALCRIADGQVLNPVRPSAETGFHAGALRCRPDVQVVFHFQTPCATALACRRDVTSLNFFVIPEIPYYIGPIAVVPYRAPGSPELAGAVVRALSRHNLIILRNHGLVTVGTDFQDVLQKAVFFELACEIILRGGRQVQPMSAADAAHLCPTLRRRGSRTV